MTERANQKTLRFATLGDAPGDARRLRKRLPGRLIRHVLDAHHETPAAHVAHDLERRELLQSRLEVIPDGARVAEQLLFGMILMFSSAAAQHTGCPE